MIQDVCLTLLSATAVYFLLINCSYAVLMYFSKRKIQKFRREDQTAPETIPGVSFLIPAYNEESLIVETIQTYLSLPQAKKEIIVINDGSHDKTMHLLRVMYSLHRNNSENNFHFQSVTFPELKVLEVPHAGKSRALNFGLLHCKYDLVCTMDADTIPTARGVEACLRAFARDPKLMAAGGVIQVLSSNLLQQNSPLSVRAKEWLTSFQRIEYLRTFVCERLGWSYLGSAVLISGAFCMVRKQAIEKIGGFSPRSITEDFDLIVRLRRTFRKDARFKILPVTTCYTQVPRTLSHLSKQRMRWQMGLVQTLFNNGSLLFNPARGMLGLVVFPYFWLVEVLSPVVVFVSYSVFPYALFSGWIDWTYVALYFGAGLFFNVLITLVGLSLDYAHVSKSRNTKVSEAVIETVLMHFGYKQLTAWWRLLALMKSLSKRPSWGEKPRVELIHQN